MSGSSTTNPSLSFLAAWRDVVGAEGGYSNNPADPGGETMWGITANVARANGYNGPMRELPQPTAEAIGYAVYWRPYFLDKMPPMVAAQVFDAVYNSGPENPIRWLQACCNVTQDGEIGPVTLAAVNAVPESKMIGRFDARRLLFMANLNTWPDFGRGWARRVANNLLRGEG
jgi:lysozyme family protein